ncbi:MAG: hypothetical protein WCE30_28720 [Mycobacterium sp.]
MSNSPTAPQKISLPNLVAQFPLAALDVLKTEIPVFAAAIPLPGMSALPAIAEAFITPLQQAVSGLASAANGLPFMQFDFSQTSNLPMQLPTDHYLRTTTSPAVRKPKAAGPDPLSRDIAPDAPVLPAGTPAAPPKPPEQIFGAANHFDTQPEFRSGYPEYLRAAGMSEVAAVAVPGFAGIITLTAAGGLLGYRQARAGHATAPSRAARFVNLAPE